MMRFRMFLAHFLVLALVLALWQPAAGAGQDDADGIVIAQDDDDDSEVEEPDDDDSAVPDSDDDIETSDDDEADEDDDDPLFDADGQQIDRPIPNQAVVGLRSGVDPATFAASRGIVLLRTIPAPNIVLIQLEPAQDDDAEVAALRSDGDVDWIEPNVTNQSPEGRPRYFFTSIAGGPQVVDSPSLPGELAYSPDTACATGDSVIVAVLDTGIDASHPALAGSVLPNGVDTRLNTFDVRDIGNGADDDGDGETDEMVGHGTHVSGTVLQVAPGAMILPVKVLDSDGVGDAFSVAAGIYYAVEQQADVINLSLGSTYDSTAIRQATDHAQAEGVVVVAAAGNSDRQEPVEYPAASPAVISVAATTSTGDKAAYSNYGPTIDITAPGNDVASAYPGNLYTTASGTSMATPLVTGTAALLLERQPNNNPAQVLTVLQASSRPLQLTEPGLKGLMGSGELDIDASLSCAG